MSSNKALQIFTVSHTLVDKQNREIGHTIIFCRLVGVWNLPLRRGEVKKKVTRVADSLVRQIDEAMKNDLQQSIDAVRAEVEQLTRPYGKAAEEESIRVTELQKELQKLDSHLRDIRQRVQNLGA